MEFFFSYPVGMECNVSIGGEDEEKLTKGNASKCIVESGSLLITYSGRLLDVFFVRLFVLCIFLVFFFFM